MQQMTMHQESARLEREAEAESSERRKAELAEMGDLAGLDEMGDLAGLDEIYLDLEQMAEIEIELEQIRQGE